MHGRKITNLERFDLNLLIAFEALMTEGQVTRAARRLHITQPALSNALARLRAAFDDPLFVQEGKSMRPTLRARELEGPVRSALAVLRKSLEEQRFTPALAVFTARIATSDDIEAVLLAKVLNRIRLEAPGVRLAIRRVAGVFEAPTEDLASGALDLAIGPFARGAHATGGLISSPLYVERIACVVRSGHPRIRRSLSKAQFLDAAHVVVYYPPSGKGMIDQLLAERGEQRRIAAEAPHFLTAMLIAAQTDLLATVSGSVAHRFGRAMDLRVHKFPFPQPKLCVNLWWHDRQTADPVHTWLRRVIIETAAGLAATQR
jgi:DNA-binding transcriptional LysR family regulator